MDDELDLGSLLDSNFEGGSGADDYFGNWDWGDDELNLGDYGYDISPGGNFDLGYVDADLEKLDPDTLDLGGVDWSTAKGIISNLGSGTVDLLKKAFMKDGNINWRNVIGAGAGILSAINRGKSGAAAQPRGYQGKIPSYTAVRSPVAGAFAPTKAGDPNRQYFSDLVYATPDKLAAAQAAAQQQTTGIATLQNAADAKRAADQAKAEAAKTATGGTSADVDWNAGLANAVANAQKDTAKYTTTKAAAGGLMGLKTGHYLRGGTDGMADKLRTTIDNNQPAALSHGEFVIPADVVSHLGNGNSEAGAQRLYAMMDKVRQARTGTKKQGKKINPDKYIPA